jgi:hypothetical protein
MTVRIVEWQLPYTWGTGIEITTDKVINLLLREENNLILVNDDNEIYTDLQLADGILPTDEFPVWVTVWRVLQSDGWLVSGTLLNFKTTSWDYWRWLYGTDGKMYYDHWTGTFTQIYSATEVDNLFTTLRWELATVAFTWDYNDLSNRPVIPQINDWTLTINQNNTLKWTFTANQATSVSVDLTDTTYPAMTAWELGTGTDTTNRVVSAKVIADYVKGKIDTLMALGKFLSLWDCVTWQPDSFPLATPYTYTTWDYFLVSTVSSANPAVNYKPTGSSYTTGQTSSVTESEEVQVWDIYIYDGSVWLLQLNHGKSIAFQEIAWDPYDNTNLATALNAKQDTLTAGTWISISSGTISNSKPYNWLTLLSYWSSTWNDFLTAFTANSIVYCKASSNTNPWTWTQSRLAFMAYVNDPTTPTEVEFQYYRSVATHSDSQQWDQVYVYKLNSTNWWTWSVTTREAYTKIAAGTWLSSSYSSGTLTLTNWGVTSVNWNTWAVTVTEFLPSWTATTGYVVTKTANGYEWAAPAGWVDISSQANNILTSWAKLRAGSQADYENLWTYDTNTVYLTI